ncbi:hypothetical protein R1sor_019087 [Riccia sorocarpa]|uniref:DUF38 domain-containing protein n=1 Tax=Riccia sorocarpa TaxID=122646 RepID=A0ABD3IF49_9MARC
MLRHPQQIAVRFLGEVYVLAKLHVWTIGTVDGGSCSQYLVTSHSNSSEGCIIPPAETQLPQTNPYRSDGTPEAVDLSKFVSDVIIEERSLLAGRKFQELSLYIAGNFLQPVDGHSDRPLLVKVLKAFVSNTTGSKHKLLKIDDKDGALSFSSEQSVWESVFSPLLDDQSSLEVISVECYDIRMLNAVFTKIPHLLANSSTLTTLCFTGAWDHFHLSDAAVKALSEGLVKTKCLRTLVLSEWATTTQFVDVLTSAFTGDAQNTSLEEIDLPADMERLGMAFEVLVSKYKNLNKIRLGLLIQGTSATLVPEYMVDNFEMVVE